jgi:hypothetical protein
MAKLYGLGDSYAPTAGTTTSTTIADMATANFSWEPKQSLVTIYNHYSSGTYFYVSFNSATASTTDYQFVCEPGQVLVSPSGVKTAQVTVYASGTGVTIGTGLTVLGWGSSHE